MTSQIILFDTPRSAAHLLERIFSKQPRSELLYTPLALCRGKQVGWLTSDAWEDGMSEADQAEFESMARSGMQRWREALAKSAANGKVLHVQDHPFSSTDPNLVLQFIKTHFNGGTFLPKTQNYTSIPDEILLFPGTVPILTIRDPRLTVPSTYRVLQSFGLLHGSGRPNFLVSTTPIWIRLMYEFYVSHGIAPLVVDADDLMTSTNFTAALARQAGLDPKKLHLSWAEASEEEKAELHPMFYASQKNLIESTGIKAERAAKNVDFEQEMTSWITDFGRDDATLVREMVDSAMPHYRYLYERRFRL